MITHQPLTPSAHLRNNTVLFVAYISVPTHASTHVQPVMAPIEPDLYNANFRPISLFSGYIVLASSLTYLITRRVLYRAYTSIPPSQATRHRQHDRQRHVRIFAGLTVLSLGVACYQLFSLLSLSYKVWAHERGEALPIGLWGRGGLFGGDEGQGLALGRWFHDTDLLRETWEIAIEKSRRFWWTQQLWLGAAAWSVFLGIEGEHLHSFEVKNGI